MSFARLLLRNLLFHGLTNLAVLLGVAVGAAVLAGALLVGDSLRGSLRDRSLEQLGWVQHAMVTGRFFQTDLADRLGAQRAASAILLRGSVRTVPVDASHETIRRVNQVMVLGVNERFWVTDPAALGAEFWQSDADGAVLNATLATELGVQKGDKIDLLVQRGSTIPREALLARQGVADVLEQVRVEVRAVISDEGPGRFNLSPTAGLARNVFVPLRYLQTKLDQTGRANVVLVGDPETPKLAGKLTLDDWGLMLRDAESRTRDLFARLDRNRDGKLQRAEWRRRVVEALAMRADKDGVLTQEAVRQFYRERSNYLSLESRQMILEPGAAAAALAVAREHKVRAAPTLVYLANEIRVNDTAVPYSVIAALDPTEKPPLGPFLPANATTLADEEIVLAEWSGSPLKGKPGDTVTLTFFEPEKKQGGTTERTATFRLAGFLPLEGAAADPDLTPEFPGITDKTDIQSWDPPFPYDPKRIKKDDEDFWEKHRTTPKAYVTLTAGQKLWDTRFGSLTSIRVAGDNLTAEAFEGWLRDELKPEAGGFVFDAVRQRALESSAGFMDFGGLFLGFSFFLIAAALLLVGLLFRLNLDRRASQVGLLLALGWTQRSVRRLLLAEGAVLAALGSLLGLVGAVGYAWLMLSLLRSWWPGALDGSFLQLHVTEGYGQSFLIGFAATFLVSVLTIAWAVFALGRVAPRGLLHGETLEDSSSGKRTTHWGRRVGVGALLGALACGVGGGFVHEEEAKAGLFFGSGMLLLTSALAWLWVWMAGPATDAIRAGSTALFRLGVRNASRHPVRSMLTAGLLASAVFLVVAVESFHRTPGEDFLKKDGGSGGFALLGETDVALFQDLNRPESWDDLGVNLSAEQKSLMADTEILSLRLRAGDDASCLNLFQPGKPRLLGVPQTLIQRGGFRFSSLLLPAPDDNPWRLLETTFDDGAIPVFAEANAAAYMLKKGLGQDLIVPDERGNPVKLRFVGLMKDSVFQSEVLMSEANFLKLYPRQEGYSFFLLAPSDNRSREVANLLEANLADQGFAVLPTRRRLEAYLGVENTYLATFQALGGLGLVLGALGLAVVLLRSVWERRAELALLRALGFREGALAVLVLAENVFLLAAGTAIGTLTALLAVAPHLSAGSGTVPMDRLALLLGAVLVVALTAAAMATAATVRAPLLPALRRE